MVRIEFALPFQLVGSGRRSLQRLRLRAEMRLPGRAWLEWEATPTPNGSVLRQTAWFAPRGLAGALYWHVLYPFHAVIFGRLARALAREAETARAGA